jgi:hypothetical protein
MDKSIAGQPGNWKAPEHTSNTKQGVNMDDGDTSGYASGCADISKFDSEFDVGPVINYTVNPVNGNAAQREVENPQVENGVTDSKHPGFGSFTIR